MHTLFQEVRISKGEPYPPEEWENGEKTHDDDGRKKQAETKVLPFHVDP
jgi:hypothetical protein